MTWLDSYLWLILDVAALLLATFAAFWLARRADTNRQKFERAVGVLAVYSVVATMGFVAWMASPNDSIYGAILLGAMIGGFHIILMAVITDGVLFVTMRR